VGEETKDRPIGVYDSGVGGLTVVRWLHQVLPQERIIYFGDTARVPYGGRPREELIRFSRQIVGFFRKQGAKFIIAACNTSSAAALPVVAEESDVPLMGVIRAGARGAVSVTKAKRIGVMGTQVTVESRAYTLAVKELEPDAAVYEQACPRLVPLIEAGHRDGEIVKGPLKEYLQPLLAREIDTLILGCTHYPYLLTSIKGLVGSDVEVVDPAEAAAREAEDRLKDLGLLSGKKAGEDLFFVSGEPESFHAAAVQLGYNQSVEHVEIERYTI
jgi:glutamate racemase